jgi:hypothetical protein
MIGDSSFSWFWPVVTLVLGYLLRVVPDRYKRFKMECHVKAEFERIKHNLEHTTPNKMIKIVYGAAYVRDNDLFEENVTQVLLQYNGFEEYNTRLENQITVVNVSSNGTTTQAENMNYAENKRQQDRMIKQLEGFLTNPWLKKIPEEPSKTGFIRHMLRSDPTE